MRSLKLKKNVMLFTYHETCNNLILKIGDGHVKKKSNVKFLGIILNDKLSGVNT